ncbi:hypothetical protein [Streptomyces lunaelactis]|uniref:hypothetical protein n=1 Tax=Streptomyces lunaelactis TaxID=1535768 RepID=UPI0035A0C1B0
MVLTGDLTLSIADVELLRVQTSRGHDPGPARGHGGPSARARRREESAEEASLAFRLLPARPDDLPPPGRGGHKDVPAVGDRSRYRGAI